MRVWQSPAVVSLLVSMDSVGAKLPKKRDAVGRTRNLFLRAKAELDYAETSLAQLTALQVDEAADPAAAARVSRQKEEVGRQLLRLRKEMTHAQARATEAETAYSKALKAQEDVEDKLRGMPREQVDAARALRAKVVDAERYVYILYMYVYMRRQKLRQASHTTHREGRHGPTPLWLMSLSHVAVWVCGCAGVWSSTSGWCLRSRSR